MFTKKSKIAALFFTLVSLYGFGQLKVLSNGNVGIGTVTPTAGLDVKKNGGLIVANGLGFYGSGLGTDGLPHARLTESWGMRFVALDTRWALSTQGSIIAGYQPTGQDWGTGNGYFSGKVGIGTTTPNTKLEILGAGGGNVDLRVNGRMSSNNPDGGLWCGDNNTFMGAHDNNKIGFWNQGWRMSVLNNGNVGIGTTTPNYKLSFGGLVNDRSLAMYDAGGEFYGFGISSLSMNFYVGNCQVSQRYR